jgi:hypothetical protein
MDVGLIEGGILGGLQNGVASEAGLESVPGGYAFAGFGSRAMRERTV